MIRLLFVLSDSTKPFQWCLAKTTSFIDESQDYIGSPGQMVFSVLRPSIDYIQHAGRLPSAPGGS
jgi:hypothetical protein